ncbi:sulfite exporter TauE/SafE family protein [Ornithinimicrobium sp. Y1694]|uniref:sulfite exporter TauE/SafE family protein n=1 Tax=Ornithinimicrobium sp. Y1694 TaxID=3418590 RepID=UPI003CE6EBB7
MVLIAAFIQGSTGMGFALITVPVFSLIEPGLVPVVVLFLMLPLNAYVTARERHAIHWRGARWITLGRFFGTFAGLWIITVASTRSLGLFIGLSTIALALLALAAPTFTPGRTTFSLAGLVTGVTETSTGIGGPPYALAYQNASGPTLRATVALCFLIGEVISIVVLAMGGLISLEMLKATLMLLVPLLLGAWLSRFVHHRLDGPIVRILVLAFAIVSGIAVLIRALGS